MAPEYEFEGKTVKEAQERACEELGLSENELRTEVLSYGSSGIFGLVGVKKARIRVPVPETVKPPQAQPDADTGPEASVTDLATESLREIVSYIVEDAAVTATTTSDAITLSVEGGNAALLIGKHGKTLDALQYIVQRIVHKQGDAKTRITVDVEGYRGRRKESLTRLALRLCEKVGKTGKPATIKPMNAYDRRIVHLALKGDPKVRTQSKGTGTFRKIVIYPQKRSKQPEGN
jgi:spoIIIJ-associated protein